MGEVEAPPGLRWRHIWETEGPDFVLVRDRDGDEPECLGRVMKDTKAGLHGLREGWGWSLTCAWPMAAMPRPTFQLAGFEPSKGEAVGALLGAWAREMERRAEMRAMINAEPERPWSPYVRRFVVEGVPTPAKWSKLG